MSESSSNKAIQFILPVRTIRIVLIVIIGLLGLASLATELDKYVFLNERSDLNRMFNMSNERNFPTWYSATQILACAAVMAFIAYSQSSEVKDLIESQFFIPPGQ